jgi:hypothetical protein
MLKMNMTENVPFIIINSLAEGAKSSPDFIIVKGISSNELCCFLRAARAI